MKGSEGGPVKGSEGGLSKVTLIGGPQDGLEMDIPHESPEIYVPCPTSSLTMSKVPEGIYRRCSECGRYEWGGYR